MKIIKWIGIVLIILCVGAFSFIMLKVKDAQSKLTQTYDVTPPALEIPSDSMSMVTGKKWVTALCAECHGLDLGGRSFIESEDLGMIYAPNITPGEGGTAYYSDQDWVRAIRHGVAANGRPLLIMPARDYQNMTKEDLASTIAYIKTVLPVNRTNQETKLSTLANILLSVGGFGEDAIPAEVIDHEGPFPETPTSQSQIERGDYVVQVFGCWSCHGKNLEGSKSPDPNAPLAPTLRRDGNLANWTFDQFKTFADTGKTPEGKEPENKFMPWQALGRLPLDEQQAIFAYLQTLD